MDIRKEIASADTIVVKVGTSTITHETGKHNLMVIERLVRVLSDLRNQAKSIVLITSATIGIGRAKMGISERPKSTLEKQALVAIGQVSLMHIYSELLNEYG